MTSTAPTQDRTLPRFALALMSLVLRHRLLFAAIGFLLFAVMVGPRLVGRRSYSAEASFVPQDRQQAAPGGLASLAAQFGVAFPTSSSTESPAFYAALVTTRAILEQVVQTRFAVRTQVGDSGTLVEIWDVPGRTPEARIEEAVRRLRESMNVTIARETGTVTVRATSGNRQLAFLVVSRILELVNDFNVSKRQSQASAERKFVTERLEQVRLELAAAELKYSQFLQANRSFPQHLQYESDRLSREVSLRQQLYTSLAQANEQARVNEARNVAVITVVDQPVVPVSPNRRRLVVTTLRAMILTLVLGVLVALTLEFFRDARVRDAEEMRTLTELWRETVLDLRNPTRVVSQLRRSAAPRY